ncbi:MAG: RsmD family RNA methyltransferase [Muribaculaceae bacterium]|nr:RsmD family RNA methyltransferase [Muribaculaceae bacterium]
MRIISGKYGRRRFTVPTNISARPTTDMARENIFNVITNLIDLEDIDALDLFAGTGAVSLELLSRGCRSVTSVENASVQQRFIAKVVKELGAEGHRLVRGDVFRFIAAASPAAYDLVFADPPYDHPRFAEIPALILDSGMTRPGGLVIVEHSSKHDFSALPGFVDHRTYGSVNFSIFRIPNPEQP